MLVRVSPVMKGQVCFDAQGAGKHNIIFYSKICHDYDKLYNDLSFLWQTRKHLEHCSHYLCVFLKTVENFVSMYSFLLITMNSFVVFLTFKAALDKSVCYMIM